MNQNEIVNHILRQLSRPGITAGVQGEDVLDHVHVPLHYLRKQKMEHHPFSVDGILKKSAVWKITPLGLHLILTSPVNVSPDVPISDATLRWNTLVTHYVTVHQQLFTFFLNQREPILNVGPARSERRGPFAVHH